MGRAPRAGRLLSAVTAIAVFSGRIADDRGRRKDETTAISDPLDRLANLAIAWTTHETHAAIPAIERQGITVRVIDDS